MSKVRDFNTPQSISFIEITCLNNFTLTIRGDSIISLQNEKYCLTNLVNITVNLIFGHSYRVYEIQSKPVYSNHFCATENDKNIVIVRENRRKLTQNVLY